MYNIILVLGVHPVIRHLYNLQSNHPNKSSTYLALYMVTTVLLALFPILYFKSSWLFKFF